MLDAANAQFTPGGSDLRGFLRVPLPPPLNFEYNINYINKFVHLFVLSACFPSSGWHARSVSRVLAAGRTTRWRGPSARARGSRGWSTGRCWAATRSRIPSGYYVGLPLCRLMCLAPSFLPSQGGVVTRIHKSKHRRGSRDSLGLFDFVKPYTYTARLSCVAQYDDRIKSRVSRSRGHIPTSPDLFSYGCTLPPRTSIILADTVRCVLTRPPRCCHARASLHTLGGGAAWVLGRGSWVYA